VNSRDINAIKAKAFSYHAVITTVPHINKEVDLALQGMLKPKGKFV